MLEEIIQYLRKDVKETAKLLGYNGEIGNDDNLFDIGFDSLDIMETIVSAENKFHIEVDINKVNALTTINEIAELFTKH